MDIMGTIGDGLSAAAGAAGDFASSDLGKIVIAGAVAGVAAKALGNGGLLDGKVVQGVLGGMAIYGLSKVVLGGAESTQGDLKAKEIAEKDRGVGDSFVDGFSDFVGGIAKGITAVGGAVKNIMLGEEADLTKAVGDKDSTVEAQSASQTEDKKQTPPPQQPQRSGGLLRAAGDFLKSPTGMQLAGGAIQGAFATRQQEELAKKAREQYLYDDATHGINRPFDAGSISHTPLLQNRQLANQRLDGDAQAAAGRIRSRTPLLYRR